MDDIAQPEPDRRCPKCNCARTTHGGSTNFFGTTVEKRSCDFCHHAFRVPLPKPKAAMQSAKAAAYDHDPDAPVAYHSEAVKCTCPYCRAKNPPIYRTLPADGGVVTRYHKCTCGRTFHSKENQ